jgi:hypothetical protein
LHLTALTKETYFTGSSMWSNSHREILVINTGSLQWEDGFPVMKIGFSLWELLRRENPVLTLYRIAVYNIYLHFYIVMCMANTCNLYTFFRKYTRFKNQPPCLRKRRRPEPRCTGSCLLSFVHFLLSEKMHSIAAKNILVQQQVSY